MDLTFVIPACNEAENIAPLILEIRGAYPESEIIVVDDGSDDSTSEVSEEAGARVIRHFYRMGNGAAIKTGARAANNGTLIFMDADGQHQPSTIAPLLNEKAKGYDLVVGSRSSRKNHSSFARWLANVCYNKIASRLTGFGIRDLTSGLRVADRDKFLAILHLLPNGFSYPTTSTMAFLRSGYQVCFIDVDVKPGETKGSHISPLKDGARFFIIIFKIAMLYSPFKFLAPLALLQLALMVSLYLPGVISSAPIFTNGMALLAVGSVITLGIATLAEQVTSLMYK